MIIEQHLPGGLRPGFSPTRALALAVLLSLAWLSVCLAFSGLALALAIPLLLLWSWRIWRCYVSDSHPQSVRSLSPSERDWEIRCRDGSVHRRRLGAGTFIDARVAVLVLCPVHGSRWRQWRQRRVLLLFPDQFSAEAWHDLRLHCIIRQQSI